MQPDNLPTNSQPQAEPRSAASKAAMREYVERWRRAGPVLEGIAFLEAQELSDQQRREALERVLSTGSSREPNGPEGWIAWQKVRERWMNKTQN